MASPGIAVGEAVVFREETLTIPKYDIGHTYLDREYVRFQEAVNRAVADLKEIRQRAATRAGDEIRILDSHLMMLADPEFAGQIRKALERDRKNVEWVLIEVIEGMVDRLAATRDDYFLDRTSDFHDISRRIIGHLLEEERPSLKDLDRDVIVVAHNLMPSDTIGLRKTHVLGIATDVGGKTSHTAILARSFEIPAVLGLSNVSRKTHDGLKVIVDGNTGTVIIDPDEQTIHRYEKLRQRWVNREVQLNNLNLLPAETSDGKRVRLEANMEVPEEVEVIETHGADGIGLYRTEFLYIGPHEYPSEDRQCETIRSILHQMGDRTVVVRTLDLGGDKVVPGYREAGEDNPILGWRAVRFCLSKPAIFKTQLRAILRASVHGSMKVMFPMISGRTELDQVLEIWGEAKDDLSRRGVPFRHDIPVGIMIEVPSAALTADSLAERVDFFSIGTNDLIQYTIAVDRGNERITYLYQPFHPAVLRLIKIVIDAGHAAGIPVGMCGEMAGDPMATVVLLGLGLDSFSMSAISIPEIRRVVRSVSMEEARELANEVLQMKSFEEIGAFVGSWMEGRFDLATR